MSVDRKLHPFEARVLVAMDEVLHSLPDEAYESEFAVRNADESFVTIRPVVPEAAAIYLHLLCVAEMVDFEFGTRCSVFELDGSQLLDDLREYAIAVVQGRCGEVLGLLSNACWIQLAEEGRRATSRSFLHLRTSRVERRFLPYIR